MLEIILSAQFKNDKSPSGAYPDHEVRGQASKGDVGLAAIVRIYPYGSLKIETLF